MFELCSGIYNYRLESLVIGGEMAQDLRWAIPGKLACGRRPGIGGKRYSQVKKSVVKAWIKETRARGVRSIVCLLHENELRLYDELEVGLLAYYRSKKFHVAHINARNSRKPPLTDQQLKKAWSAYQELKKPVLVHCSANAGRAPAAARYIKQKLHSSLTRSRTRRLRA
jgi:hypothetical protein